MIGEPGLRPGQHLNLLGADGPGKAEAEVEAIAARAAAEGGCSATSGTRLAHGGELTGAVAAGYRRSRRRHGAGRGLRRPGPRPRLRRRAHAVRLDRPGDPGPGDRAGSARGGRGGRGQATDGRPLDRALRSAGRPRPALPRAAAGTASRRARRRSRRCRRRVRSTRWQGTTIGIGLRAQRVAGRARPARAAGRRRHLP